MDFYWRKEQDGWINLVYKDEASVEHVVSHPWLDKKISEISVTDLATAIKERVTGLTELPNVRKLHRNLNLRIFGPVRSRRFLVLHSSLEDDPGDENIAITRATGFTPDQVVRKLEKAGILTEFSMYSLWPVEDLIAILQLYMAMPDEDFNNEVTKALADARSDGSSI